MSLKACLLVILCTAMPQGALAQSNRQCQQHRVFGYALVLQENAARSAALAAWVAQATLRHGPMWANWNNAGNKRIACRRRTMSTGLNGYHCVADALPCILQ